MRAGEDPANDAAIANTGDDPETKKKHDMAVANKKAHDEGWQRWLSTAEIDVNAPRGRRIPFRRPLNSLANASAYYFGLFSRLMEPV